MHKKILVLGASGMVGSRFVDLYSQTFDLITPTHEELDLMDLGKLAEYIQDSEAENILYAAGFTNVNLSEGKKEETKILNVDSSKVIAESAEKKGIGFCYLSTDYVFDGKQKERPYTEEDLPNPVNSVYAISKWEGEKAVQSVHDSSLIVRLIMPFSANFTKKIDIVRIFLEKLKRQEKIKGIVDQKINPIYVDDLAHGLSLLLEKNSTGIYHVAATDFVTPFEFAKTLARTFELDESLVEEISFSDYFKNFSFERPQYTWLDTSKFRNEFGEGILHTVEEEVRLFKSQWD